MYCMYIYIYAYVRRRHSAQTRQGHLVLLHWATLGAAAGGTTLMCENGGMVVDV